MSELTDFTQTSLQMQDAARDGDWVRVSELEQDHMCGLRSFFNNHESPNQAELVNAIQHMLWINQEIIELATESKKNVMQQLSKFQLGRMANIAYGKNQDF